MSDDAQDFCLVYVTTPSQSVALQLAQAVVSQRLAACANVLGDIQSVYWWDGAVQNDTECALLLKTRRDLFPALEAAIRDQHPYDCPCIVALPLVNGSAGFLQWLKDQTNSQVRS